MANQAGPHGLRATVAPAVVTLRAGTRAAVDVTVFNGTGRVDQFTIGLISDAVELAEIPETLSLLPDAQGTVRTQLILPPGSEIPNGEFAVGVRVASQVHADVMWVAEVRVTVPPEVGLSIGLHPQLLKGGSRAATRVQLTNTGNVDLTLTLRGEDPEGAVRFEFSDVQPTVPHHRRAEVRLTASASRRVTGSPERRTLVVTASGPGVNAEARGAFLQRAVLPPVLMRLFVPLVVLAAVFGGLFVAGVIPPGGETTTTTAPAQTESETTTPPVPAQAVSIDRFSPTGQVDESGCVELSWSVSNATSIRLDTPRDGSSAVTEDGNRVVCGNDGDTVTLSATGDDGREDSATFPISFKLVLNEPTVTVEGRTLVVDVMTNQAASVELGVGGMTDRSSGTTNHHLAISGLEPGAADWDVVASAPDQLDVTTSGSIDVPYHYVTVALTSGPDVTVDPSSTTTSGDVAPNPFAPPKSGDGWTIILVDPVRLPLGGCGGQLDQFMSEALLPVASDGSVSFTVIPLNCVVFFDPDAINEVTFSSPAPLSVSLAPGFEERAETEEFAIEMAPGITVDFSLTLERIVSAGPRDVTPSVYDPP